jgi:hypothetical protein
MALHIELDRADVPLNRFIDRENRYFLGLPRSIDQMAPSADRMPVGPCDGKQALASLRSEGGVFQRHVQPVQLDGLHRASVALGVGLERPDPVTLSQRRKEVSEERASVDDASLDAAEEAQGAPLPYAPVENRLGYRPISGSLRYAVAPVSIRPIEHARVGLDHLAMLAPFTSTAA